MESGQQMPPLPGQGRASRSVGHSEVPQAGSHTQGLLGRKQPTQI